MMTKRIPKSAAAPLIVFAGVEVACLLAFESSTAFLIESAFFLATLAMVVSAILRAADGRSALFGFPKVIIAAALFVLQGILCIASAALGDASLPRLAVASFALLVVGTVALIADSDAEAHAERVQKSVDKVTCFMDDVRLKLSALAAEAQGETKSIVERVSEEARLANPKSTPATEEVDLRMAEEVERLTDSVRRGDVESAQAIAANLKSLIKQHSAISKQTSDR